MKTNKSGSLITMSSAFIFIVLFTYTAINKLYEFQDFSEFLAGLQYLGPFANQIAILIPGAELSISALLLFPKTRIKGIYASFILMLLFTIYLIYMKLTATNLPCHCGGAFTLLSWTAHIFVNIIFITLAGLTICYQQRNRHLNHTENQFPSTKDNKILRA